MLPGPGKSASWLIFSPPNYCNNYQSRPAKACLLSTPSHSDQIRKIIGFMAFTDFHRPPLSCSASINLYRTVSTNCVRTCCCPNWMALTGYLCAGGWWRRTTHGTGCSFSSRPATFWERSCFSHGWGTRRLSRLLGLSFARPEH